MVIIIIIIIITLKRLIIVDDVISPFFVFFPVENAIKDSRVERAVGLCRKIVGSLSHSWKRRRLC